MAAQDSAKKALGAVGYAVSACRNNATILIKAKSNLHTYHCRDTIRSNECLILLNGPSVRTTFARPGFDEFASGKDIMCVNNFAGTNEYGSMKPSHYVLMDRLYWDPSVSADDRAIRDGCFRDISERTTWKLNLFMPYQASRTVGRSALANDFVSKRFYNLVWLRESFDSHLFARLRRGLGVLAPFSVLIPALQIAINLGYERIYVVGADHSWHETISMGDDNVLRYKLSYNSTSGATGTVPLLGYDSQPFRISEFFWTYYHVFKSYEILERYANHRGAKVLNASERSYIDAFARYHIPET